MNRDETFWLFLFTRLPICFEVLILKHNILSWVSNKFSHLSASEQTDDSHQEQNTFFLFWHTSALAITRIVPAFVFTVVLKITVFS
jgi:hypothetical protein